MSEPRDKPPRDREPRMDYAMQPLRVAAIGAGGGATAHFEAARLTEAFEVAGVLDVDAQRARAQAARHGIARCYGDLDELLSDDGASCVAVLTPPDTHEALTCAALEGGRHVVCEKPLGRTVEECDRMLDAAAGTGRRLLPVHNRIYSHAMTTVGELVSAGKLGSVVLAESTGIESPATVDAAGWLRTDASLGGVVIAQATHPLYVLRWLLGDAARVTAGAGALTLEMTGEDSAALIVEFRSGALASLIATFAATPGSGDHAIRLFGTTGTLETTLRGGTRERPERLRAVLPSRFGDDELHELPLPASDGWITSFQRMWEDYAQAIQNDGPALVSAEDGREAVRLVAAAYQSMREARAVVLEA
jgi:UDP-N-acetyl-2-amino-2-deoxyglucuronate dehydrogenase